MEVVVPPLVVGLSRIVSVSDQAELDNEEHGVAINDEEKEVVIVLEGHHVQIEEAVVRFDSVEVQERTKVVVEVDDCS